MVSVEFALERRWNMIEFINPDVKYINEAIELAVREYEKERLSSPQMISGSMNTHLRYLMEALFRQRYGKLAIEDGRLIGYIVFWGPIEGFFGNVNGVFSPQGGNVFSHEDRGRLASMLYERAAADLVRDGILSHAVSLYAHDEEVLKSFVFNGFGIRCSDAVMRLSERDIIDPEAFDGAVKVTELTGDERLSINELRKGLSKHMSTSPIFMPEKAEWFDNWPKEGSDQRVFAAVLQGKVVGYILICSEEGETFMTRDSSMMNICGAYVAPEYRKMSIAPLILEHVCRVCEADGYTYLGVDCETLNPTALRFWRKYFQNYTYSCNRRIDERVPFRCVTVK